MDEPQREDAGRDTAAQVGAHLELLRQFLTDRDTPCPQCGYNLRKMVSDRCPECGQRIALGVQLVEPRQAAPIAGLIGLSAGAGLNGLLLIYLWLMRFRYPDANTPGNTWALIAGGFIVIGCLLLVWLRFWKRIRGQSSSVRWLLAAACWAVTLADLVMFTFFIR